MPDTITCPDCGTVYPAGGFGGMCPQCLMSDTFPEQRGAGEEIAGARIDRFTLIEKLGEGGMGSVWKARQDEPVQREVALKLIKLGMDTSALVARFESERQVLATLDHPNIAKIFDAGSTGSGRPYYAMELVDGVPVTELCEKHHLDVRRRLELFMQICAAVGHAHQKGVIHRDLKPSNILVADHPETRLKVIDFGIAKAADDPSAEETLVTREGQIVGTPGYMSPEQADGAAEIDGRSDVYSLGALLYEMLSGTPPFNEKSLRNAGLLEVIRIIKEDEPAKPSTRLGATGANPQRPISRISSDLDWIALKALAKDPARRYESPAALADDIARHLNHQPITASPPAVTRRVVKFLRRHPTAVVACVALLLAAALALALVLNSPADRPDPAADETVAQVLFVTTLLDQDPGSLRHCVDTSPAGSEIRFHPSLAGKTIALTGTAIIIDHDLLIDAADLPQPVTIDAGGLSGVFRGREEQNIHLRGLVVTGGHSKKSGGGISNNGANLTLTKVIVTGNIAESHGGGVQVGGGGTVTMTDCTISNNQAAIGGGLSSFEDTEVSNTTFSGNIATKSGGGIFKAGGRITISNGTVTANQAAFGAGIAAGNWSHVTLRNVTLVGNRTSADHGSCGIGVLENSKLILENSVVAENEVPEGVNRYDLAVSGLSTVESRGTNLIGRTRIASGQTLEGVHRDRIDLKLAPLDHYRGPSPTMPPLPGSPLIDAAIAGEKPLPTDQRGVERPIDGDGDGTARPDIGAAEFDPSA